jgi:hypothetical protein
LSGPADNTTSCRAFTSWSTPATDISTPVARRPSVSTRVAVALGSTVRFGRFSAGLKYATAALERRPLRVEY